MTQIASIRGWIEGALEFDQPIGEVIERHRSAYEGASQGWKLRPQTGYRGWWAFGACMNTPGFAPWLREQLEEIAALPPPDSDEDHVVGFFLVSPETGLTMEWHIRDGA